MFRSLRARLVLMTLVVAGVAVATVGLLSRRLTMVEFQRFVTSAEEVRVEHLAAALKDFYRERGGWDGVQPLVERQGEAAGRQLILLGPNRGVLAAYPRELLASNVRISPDHHLTWEQAEAVGGRPRRNAFELRGVPHIALTAPDGTHAGTLYHTHLPSPTRDAGERVFVRGLDRVLLVAGVCSALAALLAALLLSRRVLRPVEALTEAARRMGRGEGHRLVAVTSGDEIGELARAFNSMAESLATTERLRRNMVSDVAHELRTPLTNIRCQLETLQDGLARPTADLINSLHEEAMLLSRLVDDLQELALAEAGQLRLEPQALSVKDEAQKSLEALRRQVEEAGLSAAVEVPEGLEAYADPSRFGQVLRNLLTNAITHTPPGGEVRIRARRAGREVEVEVRDTGRGIAPESLPFVFERFYRDDASRDRRTGGAGLGLAIVKQIVAAHGGRVWAESEVGKGSAFHFTVPHPTSSGDR